jgi:hypothetical protein
MIYQCSVPKLINGWAKRPSTFNNSNQQTFLLFIIISVFSRKGGRVIWGNKKVESRRKSFGVHWPTGT